VTEFVCRECGCINEVAEKTAPRQLEPQRSYADHNMFWAIVTAACKNWPESHPFQPHGVNEKARIENLYGWLLVEVGYVDVGDVQSHEVHSIHVGLTAARRTQKRGRPLHYWRLAPTESGWQLITPRSLSKDAAGKRLFEDVRSQVYEVIEVTLGRPIESLKSGARQEAA
jgi:hypothetical protein